VTSDTLNIPSERVKGQRHSQI